MDFEGLRVRKMSTDFLSHSQWTIDSSFIWKASKNTPPLTHKANESEILVGGSNNNNIIIIPEFGHPLQGLIYMVNYITHSRLCKNSLTN